MVLKHLFFLFFSIVCSSIFGQELHVSSSLNNLRLRDEPNLASKVVKIVQKEEYIGKVIDRTSEKMKVTWNGVEVLDYWYKTYVKIDTIETITWVFGKGIKLTKLGYGQYEEMIEPQNIDNDWISIKYVDKPAFDKIRKVPMRYKSQINHQKNEFTLKYSNGKTKVFKEDDNGYETFLIGEFKDIGYYLIDHSGCCSSYRFVNKVNGKEYPAYPPFGSIENQEGYNKFLPIFAPDKHTYLYIANCEPGGEYSFGFATINDKKTKESIIEFDHLRIKDFRFVTNTSGIAWLESGKYLQIKLK